MRTFDPGPWFAAISNALPSVDHPLLRRALEDAYDEIRIFSERYPVTYPLHRVPMKARRVLHMFLTTLINAGFAPPEYPQLERGAHEFKFNLVAIDFPAVHKGKGGTAP